jgi:hypothetical protein
MEFELSQFSDDLLDPAPADQDTPPVDEPVAPAEPTVDPEPTTEPEPTVEPVEPVEPVEDDSNLDAYTRFLKSKGIRDGKTIVYEDEDTGETSEVDFSTLTAEEQFNILNELTDPGLSEDELQTINFLRTNNVTMQDVIAFYQEQAIKEYIEKNSTAPQQVYSVDQYNDEELYLADLKSRYPDMTDEELTSELESAKDNEELFAKKAEIIRNRYKAAEEAEKQARVEEQKKAQDEYRKGFETALDNFNYVPMDYKDPNGEAMQIERNEKAAIWDYLYSPDANGQTAFQKDLQNHDKVVEMAWRMLFSAEAMSDMTQYWKGEVKKSRRAAEPPKPKTSTTTVVKKEDKPKSVFDNNDHTSLNPGWGQYL